MPDLTSAFRPYLPTIHISVRSGVLYSGPCHIWAASLTLLPPDQKYNSLGALSDSWLIAPSWLHWESGAVFVSLRYRQSIILQPPLWWELAVALNPILRSRSSRFLIMSYSNISKSFCQRLIYIINATDINITSTPNPIPIQSPSRKALASRSILGKNLISISLIQVYIPNITGCQGIVKCFFKIISKYAEKMPIGHRL